MLRCFDVLRSIGADSYLYVIPVSSCLFSKFILGQNQMVMFLLILSLRRMAFLTLGHLIKGANVDTVGQKQGRKRYRVDGSACH